MHSMNQIKQGRNGTHLYGVHPRSTHVLHVPPRQPLTPSSHQDHSRGDTSPITDHGGAQTQRQHNDTKHPHPHYSSSTWQKQQKSHIQTKHYPTPPKNIAILELKGTEKPVFDIRVYGSLSLSVSVLLPVSYTLYRSGTNRSGHCAPNFWRHCGIIGTHMRPTIRYFLSMLRAQIPVFMVPFSFSSRTQGLLVLVSMTKELKTA